MQVLYSAEPPLVAQVTAAPLELLPLLTVLLDPPLELLPPLTVVLVAPLEPHPKIPQPLEPLLLELLLEELLLVETTVLEPELEELDELDELDELEELDELTVLVPVPVEPLLPLLEPEDAPVVLAFPLELLPLLPPGPLPPVNAQRPSEHSKPAQQSGVTLHDCPELRQTPPPLLVPFVVVLGGQAARQSTRPAASETRCDMNDPPGVLRLVVGYYDRRLASIRRAVRVPPKWRLRVQRRSIRGRCSRASHRCWSCCTARGRHPSSSPRRWARNPRHPSRTGRTNR